MHNTETVTEIKCKPNTLFFFFLFDFFVVFFFFLFVCLQPVLFTRF